MNAMRLKLNEFFDNRILIGAKNLLLEEISEYIQEKSSSFDPELILLLKLPIIPKKPYF